MEKRTESVIAAVAKCDLLFEIVVRHPQSGERMTFLGQGVTVAAAVNEGLTSINAPFRPREGLRRPPNTVAVTTKTGATVCRTLAEFEAGVIGETKGSK